MTAPCVSCGVPLRPTRPWRVVPSHCPACREAIAAANAASLRSLPRRCAQCGRRMATRHGVTAHERCYVCRGGQHKLGPKHRHRAPSRKGVTVAAPVDGPRQCADCGASVGDVLPRAHHCPACALARKSPPESAASIEARIEANLRRIRAAGQFRLKPEDATAQSPRRIEVAPDMADLDAVGVQQARARARQRQSRLTRTAAQAAEGTAQDGR